MKSKKNIIIGILSAIFFSGVSIFGFPGHSVEGEDQIFYTPAILQKADPTLFQNDFLMQKSQTEGSLFDELIGFFLFHNPDNIFSVYLIFDFVSRFLFFLGIFWIALAIFKKPEFAALFPFFFLIGHVGQICNGFPPRDWFFSFAAEIHPRSVATSLLTLAFAAFFWKKRWLSWFFGALAVPFHILTALPVLGIFGLWFLFREQPLSHPKRVLPLFLPLLGLGITLALGDSSGFNIFQQVDTEWMSFLRDRVDYAFWDTWLNSAPTPFLFIAPISALFILVFKSKISKDVREKILFSVVTLGVFAFLFSLLFVVTKMIFFFQIQILRSFVWIKILLFMGGFFALFSAFQKRKTFFERSVFFIALAVLASGAFSFWPLVVMPAFLVLFPQKFTTLFRKTLFISGVSVVTVLSMLLLYQMWRLQFLEFLHAFFEDRERLFGLFLFHGTPILIFVVFFLFFKNLEMFAQKKHFWKMLAGGALGIFIGTGISFAKNFEENLFDDDCLKKDAPICEAYRAISEKVGKDESIAMPHSLRVRGRYIRNRLKKNLYGIFLDGAQGTFHREYAAEWEQRMSLSNNPPDDLDADWFFAPVTEKKIPNWKVEFQNSAFLLLKKP